VDPAWRRRSTIFGTWSNLPDRVGFYGPGRDFRSATPARRGVLQAKLPVIVRGHRPVTVHIRREDRGRAALTYGPARDRGTLGGGAPIVRFVPCADRSVTAWPGALLLASRAPLTLWIATRPGRGGPLTVGRLVARRLTADDANRLRRRIVAGLRRDFAESVHLSRRIERCAVRRFRRTLTRVRLERLLATFDRQGAAGANHRLTAIGSAIGNRCEAPGTYGPEAIQASAALGPRRWPGSANGGS